MDQYAAKSATQVNVERERNFNGGGSLRGLDEKPRQLDQITREMEKAVNQVDLLADRIISLEMRINGEHPMKVSPSDPAPMPSGSLGALAIQVRRLEEIATRIESTLPDIERVV